MARAKKGAGARSGADGLRLEVFQHLFASVCEEMGELLLRSAFSANIKERRDFSCALFDADGRMVGQAAHLPVHLGSTALSVAAALEECALGPGDAVVLNDPYRGGTHLPDVTVVSPVHLAGAREPAFFAANRAHHADVGGSAPGSMAPARDVHGEGVRIPPVHLVRGGEVVRDTLELLLANMRVPRERKGDLLGQVAANRLACSRLEALAREHSPRALQGRAAELLDWTEALARTRIRGLRDGAFAFEDELELGAGARATIRLRLRVRGDRLECDFRDTDDAVDGPVNTVRAVVLSAVFYVLRLLLPEGTPTNAGVLRPVTVHTRAGSLVDARYPRPVAAGNVETSQRLVDVLLGALAQAAPELVPAASAGTMSNLAFGGSGPRGDFAYYETNGGGAGGGPAGAGAHALQTHMTNTRNTPIEALEREFPVRVLESTVRRGSGGRGERARGGDGIRRRLRFLAPARVSWIADRQDRGPWGLAGGSDGATGRASVRRAGAARWRRIAGKAALDVDRGDELSLETPGGGGFGSD